MWNGFHQKWTVDCWRICQSNIKTEWSVLASLKEADIHAVLGRNWWGQKGTNKVHCKHAYQCSYANLAIQPSLCLQWEHSSLYNVLLLAMTIMWKLILCSVFWMPLIIKWIECAVQYWAWWIELRMMSLSKTLHYADINCTLFPQMVAWGKHCGFFQIIWPWQKKFKHCEKLFKTGWTCLNVIEISL